MKDRSLTFFENKLLVSLSLILTPLLLYFKSFYYDFTPMDEQWMIVNNVPFLNSGESLKSAFTGSLAGLYYRPLFLVSIIIDFHIDKVSPIIYHITNLLWHITSIILLFRYLTLLEVEKKTAFILAMLFSVHPILLHAVAWVPGRNDVMLCVFTLLSLIFLHLYLTERKTKQLLLQLLFFVCALLTKETAIILPIVYLAYYFICFNTIKKNRIQLIGMWMALAVLFYIIRANIVEHPNTFNYNLISTLKNFIGGLLLYIGKLIFPFQQSVFPTLKHASVIPGLITLILIGIFYFKLTFKNKRIALFGLVLLFILLAIPVWFGATKGNGEHYEHRAYTSLVGLLLFASQIKYKLNSKLLIAFSISIILLFGIKTFTRMNVYENKYSFLATAITECPDYYLFQLQMADMYLANSEWEKAISYYDGAIKMRPDKAEMYNNRGTAYLFLGKNSEAIVDFNLAIEKSKFRMQFHLNRCNAYYNNGEYENAMKDLIVLLGCCKESIPPELENGLKEKWSSSEIEKIDKELALHPKDGYLYFNRSQILFSVGENKKGLADLKTACELDAENQEYLSLYLKKSGEMLGM